MQSVAIPEAIEGALRRCWPSRAHRELLLDLGERKGWDETEFGLAVQQALGWLVENLHLPTTLAVPTPRAEPDLRLLRPFAEELAGSQDLQGVSRWIVGIAPALGVGPKTLANSLKGGLQSRRADHRWLSLIVRVLRGEAAPDAWAFHRRSPTNVANELAHLAGSSVVDAGDAVLLSSLLALWQRRRPTHESRANRGVVRSRRESPKPIAAMHDGLIVPGQLRPLTELAHKLDPPHGQALWLLAVEAALATAHLAPHPARRSGSADTHTGENWLREVDAVLQSADSLIGEGDREVIRFRIDRMRAWRDKRRQSESEFEGVRSPYVRASLALERAHHRNPVGDVRFDPHTPGVLMLIPLLRRHALLVTP